MKQVNILRKEVKKYIDTADEKTLKMIHAMLEVDQQDDWWDDLREDTKTSIERGLKDGKEVRVESHETVMKKYRKWLSK